MSYDALLLDDVQLYRDAETGRDGFNQPIFAQVLIGTTRGRLFAQGTLEQAINPEGPRAVVKSHRLSLALGYDVDESTTVAIGGKRYNVLEVNVARDAAGPHHLELLVERAADPPDTSSG